MKVFISGLDGYLGWGLAQYLSSRKHEVMGCDHFGRRKWVEEMGSHSITPIFSMPERLKAFNKKFGYTPEFHELDVGDYDKVLEIVRRFKPDAIVQLGEMPSAPYSMIDFNHAWLTHQNNLRGTLSLIYCIKEGAPNCQMVKLGTMGEYAYGEDTDIPEGNFAKEDLFRGKSLVGMIFPRRAPSIYHMTKIQGTYQVDLACRFWKMTATDIMQGVCYGLDIPGCDSDEFLTRFDIDESFGTAINRFCAQAVVGLPITPFGKGHQKRGFLPIKDSLQCMGLLIEKPPAPGEYRVVNQFEEVYDVTDLAKKVQKVGRKLGLAPQVINIENPRVEKEDHYYNPDHKKLLELGYQPTRDMETELEVTLKTLIRFKDRIEKVKHTILPKIRWSGEKKPCDYIK